METLLIRRVLLAALASLQLGVRTAVAQSTDGRARPQVLVLGVYHMANPGRDVVNIEADDVLAPQRQAEILELMDVLERFRPTKVAVEADLSEAGELAQRYDAYVHGDRELTRNETEQIGFRLAHRLGHDTIYPVDADGEFPFPRVQEYAKAHRRGEALEELMSGLRRRAEAADAYLGSHTILETLTYLNSAEQVARTNAFDYRAAHLGEPGDWAGPDLVAAWFQRNIRIYSNVLQLIAGPEERILVVFGAGHLGWLRHDFATDPLVRLRTLDDMQRSGD